MLFATLVLVSINGKHNSLEERIDFCHGDETTEMCNVSWFGLKEEKKIAVSLSPIIIWKETLLEICGIFEMTGHLILLCRLASALLILNVILISPLRVPYDSQ